MAIATPLSTSGRFIVDAHGRRVRLAGVARPRTGPGVGGTSAASV